VFQSTDGIGLTFRLHHHTPQQPRSGKPGEVGDVRTNEKGITMTKHKNRETYLETAIVEMRPLFKQHGFPLPRKIKVTCGWPSKSAGRSSKRRVGECWDKSASAAGNTEISISPVLDNPIQVLDVLVHELVHAAVGTACGHKGPFRTLALALGLEGRMTATTAGPELKKHLKVIAKTLGKYPHSKIDFNAREKQTTRLLKVTCRDNNCGMIFRTTNRWVAVAVGGFICPTCGGPTKTG
jgi:hypothetical protein